MRILLILLVSIPSVAQHTVALQWNASSTPSVTYNIYRGTSSGVYTLQINPSPIVCCSFTDSQVVNGTTYYYIAKSFDGTQESTSGSNEAIAVIPTTTPCPPRGGGKNCRKK